MLQVKNEAKQLKFRLKLTSRGPTAASSREARAARDELVDKGYAECPTWQEVLAGKRPPAPEAAEPGERKHGWQYHASSQLETNFREGVWNFCLERSDKALLQAVICCKTSRPN